MLNNITSNTNVPQNTKEKEVQKKIDELKSQITELQHEISDLSNSLSTEHATIDEITNDSLSTRVIDTNSITSNYGTYKNASIDVLDGHNASFDTINTTNTNAKKVTTDSLSTKDLQVSGTFQPNNIQTTNVKASNIDTNIVCSKYVETPNAKVSNIENDTIQTKEVTTKKITSDSADLQNITTKSVTTNTLKTDDVTTKNINTECGCFSTLVDTKELDADFIQTSSIKGNGTINIQPNIDLSSQWVTIIVNVPKTKELQLFGSWSDTTTKYNWSISLLGSTETAVIAWDQSALETIKDFGFDNKSGALFIRVRAQDYIRYTGIWQSDDNSKSPIDIRVDGITAETLYVPETLRGYVFQSYDDDTTSFYFGGQVKLHSLKATIQDFDWAVYKNIGVQFNIRVPKGFDEDGQIEWEDGNIGQYLTFREVDFGDGPVKSPVWESPTILLDELHKEQLVKAEAFEKWDGSYKKGDDTLYPITELGNNTTVHGSETIEKDLEIKGDLNSPHISDIADDETEGSLVWKGSWTRQTTEDDEDKFDKIAVYESTAELKNDKPLIYDKTHESIKTADSLSLDSLDVENLNVGKDAVIGGDLYVKGTTHTVNEETISTGSDNIVLRQNAESALAYNELSGIIVNNYDGDGKVSIIGSDNEGTIRVGKAVTYTYSFDVIYLKDGKWFIDEDDEKKEQEVSGELVAYASKSIDGEYTKFTKAVFAEFDGRTVAVLGRGEESELRSGALFIWDPGRKIAKTIDNPTKNEQTLEYNNGYKWVDKKPSVYTFDTIEDYNNSTINIPNDSIITIKNETNYIGGKDIA